MSKRSIRRLTGYIILPTAATSYAIHRGLCHLEEKYPELPPAGRTSRLLCAPRNPDTQRCAYTDVYAARVPLQALEKRAHKSGEKGRLALEEAWARAAIGSSVLRVEGSIVGLLTKGRFTPGDTGDTDAGFSADEETGSPRVLLNGIATVQRGIGADEDSNGLLIFWEMPNEPRVFFEKIARWGYPWRLVSGGRHEMSVSEPFEVEDAGKGRFVEVRFSTAHDYEVVPGEGECQKVMPTWVLRLHRGFARLVLDVAVKDVQNCLEGDH